MTPLLSELHWLPVEFRCEFKVVTFACHHFDDTLLSHLDLRSACNSTTHHPILKREVLKIPGRNFNSFESTHKGVNLRSKYVTQVQQQRPESPTVTLTWHACKYKVHKLHHRYIIEHSGPRSVSDFKFFWSRCRRSICLEFSACPLPLFSEVKTQLRIFLCRQSFSQT